WANRAARKRDKAPIIENAAAGIRRGIVVHGALDQRYGAVIDVRDATARLRGVERAHGAPDDGDRAPSRVVDASAILEGGVSRDLASLLDCYGSTVVEDPTAVP